MSSPAPNKRIVLAGREFIPVGESTVAHDIAVVGLLSVAGLQSPAMREGETPDAYGFRLLHSLIEAKALLPLLGCLIMPASAAPARPGILSSLVGALGPRREAAPAGWTPAVQAETVAFLADLDEPQDKTAVYGLVAELLFPFLKAGLAPWTPSRTSSTAAPAPAPTNDAPGEGATSVPGGS